MLTVKVLRRSDDGLSLDHIKLYSTPEVEMVSSNSGKGVNWHVVFPSIKVPGNNISVSVERGVRVKILNDAGSTIESYDGNIISRDKGIG